MLATSFLVSCNNSLSSEVENQLKNLLDTKYFNNEYATSYKLTDAKTVYQNDSLIILQSILNAREGHDDNDKHEWKGLIEYAQLKSHNNKKYEVCAILRNEDEYIVKKKFINTTLASKDSISIITQIIKRLQKDGKVVGSEEPVSPDEFMPSLNTGFWELGVPPYPDQGLKMGEEHDLKAVYMTVNETARGNGIYSSSHAFFHKNLVLIITKDNHELLKKRYTDSELAEIVNLPDFSTRFPEYRVSFRVTGANLTQAKDASCDINIIRTNGDTCFTTHSSDLIQNLRNRWSDYESGLKVNGIEKDGDFVGWNNYKLLQELYKEDCLKVQLTLHPKWLQPDIDAEFTLYTHGLKEALKQL